jgi:acyl-CoA synthetase (NDP forming)
VAQPAPALTPPPATATGLDRFAERRPPRDLEALFRPRRVAIVGASDTSGRGNYLIESLRFLGFRGDVYPVNPSRREIWGLPCYPSLEDVPERPDHAVILVGKERVAGVVETCGRLGVRAATVIASGYAENAESGGERLQADLTEMTRRHGIALCGPNCQGVIDRAGRAAPYAGPIDSPILPGKIAVISQSGGNASSLITSAYDRHVGLTHVVSCGNEADLDLCDYLDYLLDDRRVGAFCLFIETIRDPLRFLELAGRAMEAHKPIIAVKVGRSAAAREAALAHTGAFAGHAEFDDAFLATAGVLRASSLDDAIDRCIVFDQLPRRRWPRGARIGMTTIGGGAAGLSADLAAAAGLEVLPIGPELRGRLAAELPGSAGAHNPVDLPGATLTADPKATTRYVQAWAAAPEVDSLVFAVRLARESRLATLEPVLAAAREVNKPVIICSPTVQAFPAGAHRFIAGSGAVLVYGLDRTFAALSAATEYARYRRRGRRRSPEPWLLPARLGQQLMAERGQSRRAASPEVTAALIEAVGLRVARHAYARDPDAAGKAADELGYPVALKIADADLAPHKTELAGVALGLRDSATVATAARRMQARFPGALLLVQEMIVGAFELFLGSSDQGHGYPPLVVAGAGGIVLEAVGDVATAIAPVSLAGARRQLGRLRSHRVMAGFRGRPGNDIEAAAEALVGLSRLAATLAGTVAEIDINPLLVNPRRGGATVVDAVVVYARSTGEREIPRTAERIRAEGA